MRRALTHLGALSIFAALSIAIFGAPLIARGFSSFRVGDSIAGDPQVYMWGLAWYPHAISHGLDPLYSTAVWAPSGFNLAWSTTVPGVSLVAWPLMRLWGLIPAYNVLTLLAPALASFTAFVLYSYITGAFWPSLIGGVVFGFSPYMQVQLLGHMVLFLVFIVPLLPYLVLLHLDGRLGRPAFAVLLASCLVLQFLVSPEVFTTATIFGAAGLIAAWRFFPKVSRAQWKNTAVSLGFAYGAVILVLSPYIARFFGRQFELVPIFNPAHCSADALNFVLPTEFSVLDRWFGSLRPLTGWSWRKCEPGAFLGLLPVLIALFLWKSRSRSRAHYLTIIFVLACAASLGPVLHVNGAAIAPLLWLWAVPIPLVNNALPARFMLYAFLVGGLIVALWLAERGEAGEAVARKLPHLHPHPHPLPGQGEGVQISVGKPVPKVYRWLLAGAVVASMMPAIPFSRWMVREDLPKFFTKGMYTQYLHRDETVLILPTLYFGNSMLWQAASDFYFRMPEGYLGKLPEEFQAWPIVGALNKNSPYIPGYEDQFRAFLADHNVSAIVVGENDHPPFERLCSTVKAERLHVGGVYLYRLDPRTLAPYRHLGAAEMEARYDLLRLRILIEVARRYIAAGKSLDQLSPSEAVALNLLSPEMAGDYPPSQIAGYWPIDTLRRKQSFQQIISWIMRTVPLRYRLAQELGPAPKFSGTTTGIWLGPWDDGAIAIGVVGTPHGLHSVISGYGRSAEKIYFPYPAPYSGHLERRGSAPQLLLMVFKRSPPHEASLTSSIGRAVRKRHHRTAANHSACGIQVSELVEYGPSARSSGSVQP